jgi:hypothetical protein
LSELVASCGVDFFPSPVTLPDLRFLSDTELNFFTGFLPAFFVASSPLELSLELEELDESELELEVELEDELPDDELRKYQIFCKFKMHVILLVPYLELVLSSSELSLLELSSETFSFFILMGIFFFDPSCLIE